ncbi:MAG: response regulator [Calditrichaceae bacterium]|nr:response regulator [Calditrichaceae bacterium]MBN2709482.1 response regulator [Calditrichaceae bacterium]RQV94807.1 MAG: response regulator [Calditrichota bacterium]
MPAKRTIILVDDEEAILLSLQRILELSGEYEVLKAASAKAALKILRDQNPDLIISDILMPEMDGLEFCRKIRQSPMTRNTPFIFLTAKKDYMVEGIKAGGDDFIIKPFSVDEVLAKIEALFRRVKTTEEQVSQIKGRLGEDGLDKVLKLAHEKNITGELLLQNGTKIGKIELKAGEIVAAYYKHHRDDSALDILMSWKGALFVIKLTGMKAQPDFWIDRTPQESNRFDEPVEIADNIWWVGNRDSDSLIPGNPYLRRFMGNDKIINYLINPGSALDFPVISKKISAVINNISNIHLYSLCLPDPHICTNALFIRNANSRSICITSEENWQLISHYEINPKSVKLINSFKDGMVTLATGHKLQFIHVPYCRSKGAFIVYDLQARILFSGDLFSGICESSRKKQLYADEEDWNGVRAFHQLYIPSGAALRNAIQLVQELKPAPILIAPHHGFILRGEIKDQFIERLYYLEVGSDLLNQEYSKAVIENYIESANELIKVSAESLELDRIIQKLKKNPRVMPRCEIKKYQVTNIFSKPDDVFEQIVMTIVEGEDSKMVNYVKSQALKISQSRGLPAPVLDWDADQTLTGIPKQIFSE